MRKASEDSKEGCGCAMLALGVVLLVPSTIVIYASLTYTERPESIPEAIVNAEHFYIIDVPEERQDEFAYMKRILLDGEFSSRASAVSVTDARLSRDGVSTEFKTLEGYLRPTGYPTTTLSVIIPSSWLADLTKEDRFKRISLEVACTAELSGEGASGPIQASGHRTVVVITIEDYNLIRAVKKSMNIPPLLWLVIPLTLVTLGMGIKYLAEGGAPPALNVPAGRFTGDLAKCFSDPAAYENAVTAIRELAQRADRSGLNELESLIQANHTGTKVSFYKPGGTVASTGIPDIGVFCMEYSLLGGNSDLLWRADWVQKHMARWLDPMVVPMGLPAQAKSFILEKGGIKESMYFELLYSHLVVRAVYLNAKRAAKQSGD